MARKDPGETKRTVVIGFLGSTLDAGRGAGRWEKWRPTVSLCRHEELLVHRLDLLYSPGSADLMRHVRDDLHHVSPESEVRPHELALKDPWDFEEVYGALHEFASRYAFDLEHEDYLVHITTGTHVVQICLFLLAEARYFPARLLQTAPRKQTAGDPGSFSIIDLDLSRYDRIATRFAREKLDAQSFLKSGIPTRNAAFNRMIDQIEQVAIRSKAPLLLIGPTGAGKSHLARRIYDLKKARHQIAGPFVEINCATLRGDAAMSALFGHVKGAFTGAQSDRPGLLKSAHEGYLFLDEIGELGGDEQAMLLRAIEEKRFLPVGSDREVASDFQLIAGTNRDLMAAVGQGGFREDLFARLNLWTFYLPGLSQRQEDIEPNVEFELERFARQQGAKVTFNREAREAYLRYAVSADAQWSGNFRDLSASITRMATLAPAGRISIDEVKEEIERLRRHWRAPSEPAAALVDAVLGDRAAEVDLFERAQLEAVLGVCRESKSLSGAGRRLFAVSRARKASSNDADRLRKYLARFGLDWESASAADRDR